MSLAPVPSEQPEATCANCGAAVVADQRYCLSCGQPVSPVRLAFLDVLAPAAAAPAGSAPAAWAMPATIEAAPGSYLAVPPPQGANAWLRRNAGLLGLVAVLGLFLLTGLLVGHWVSASKTPSNAVIKVEGLGGLAGAGTGAAGGSGTSSGTSTSSSSSTPSSNAATVPAATPKQEKAEAEEAKKIEKTPPPKPKKATTQLNKLSKSTGKKHQEEINSLGATPIETG